MHATTGDRLLVHGRTVGQHDHIVEIIEVLGDHGDPPYRVRDDSGHEAILSPGPDAVVRHAKSSEHTR
ncbi:DUF1918 domain-containing protein [Streptomyces sp. NPDC059080]|uniref:DUF1918 domain-containing protein n=1 Tax=Streptomyces sp. NPDC059080 TaxID=3346718 RepID=UPI00368041BB